MTLDRTLIYTDAALATLPDPKDGTPLAREVYAIRKYLRMAKGRLMTMKKKEQSNDRS